MTPIYLWGFYKLTNPPLSAKVDPPPQSSQQVTTNVKLLCIMGCRKIYFPICHKSWTHWSIRHRSFQYKSWTHWSIRHRSFQYAINLGHTEALDTVALLPPSLFVTYSTSQLVFASSYKKVSEGLGTRRGSKCSTSLDDASNDDRHTVTLKTMRGKTV